MEGNISKMIGYVMEDKINKIPGCMMDCGTNTMMLILGISLCFMILIKNLIIDLTTLITVGIRSSGYARYMFGPKRTSEDHLAL